MLISSLIPIGILHDWKLHQWNSQKPRIPCSWYFQLCHEPFELGFQRVSNQVCKIDGQLGSMERYLKSFSWKTLKHRIINDISDFSHHIVKSVYAVSRRPTKWQSVAKLTPTNCAYQLQRTVYLVASSFFSRKHEKIKTPGKPNHRRGIYRGSSAYAVFSDFGKTTV